MIISKLLALALLFFVLSDIHTQIRPISFNHLSLHDGLPHNTINDITQDKLGNIWIATDDGVSYYNNNQFKTFKYNKLDSNSIRNNQVLKLHIDNKGKLWLGSKVSLELYDEMTETFKHFYLPNLPMQERVHVIEIYQQNDSTLLIGTDGGGLRCFNTNTYTQKEVLPNDCCDRIGLRVSAIHIDEKERIWLGTLDKGLFVVDPNGNDFKIKSFCANSEIRSIIAFKKDYILVATYDQGLLKVCTRDLTLEPFFSSNANQASPQRIFDLVSSDEYLYIGTDGDGLIKYNYASQKNEAYKNYGTNTKSVSNNVIRCIFRDREQNLWLGHFNGGISLARNKKCFTNLNNTPQSNNSLSHSVVTSLLEDNDHNIWIGTDGGGVNLIKNGVLYNANNVDSKNIISDKYPKNILALYQDKSSNVWLGSYLQGIYIYNPIDKSVKSFRTLYPELKLSDNDIRCFMQDRLGNLWIGTNGGGVNIVNLKDKTLQILKKDTSNLNNSLSLDWVRTIFEDELGYIWIGTTYGLNTYDPINKTFRHYLYNENDSGSISGDIIYSINQDDDKQIWIGTEAGLNKYNRKTDNFTHYSVEDGLPSNTINAIINTHNGYLWLSTNNGLSKFGLKDTSFVNYNITDGLLSNSFVNGSFTSSHDGNLYFGSIAGLSYFNPKDIKADTIQIPTILTDFKIQNRSIGIRDTINNRVLLNKSITYTDTVELLKKENLITINYSSLSYAYNDKVEYEYRLLGFSDIWNNNKKKNSVTYTNLKPGTYTFQIRVVDNSIEHPIRNLTIIVLPPFYETIWFKLIAFISLIALLNYLYLLRLKMLKKERDILQYKYTIKKQEAERQQISLNDKINDAQEKYKKNEMDYKSAQLISTTVLLTHKNERMTQVKNKISTFCKEADDPALRENLKELIKTIDSEFKVEEDWGRFEEHFNNVHKDFIKRLKEKYPELSHSYLRLCAYLKLDLSTKEIASLMNISHRGVEKSRSRLRKKLNLSPEVKLNSFIASI